jgi:hypothetical protein
VEDALHAIGQTFARLGSPDIRKDAFGDIDFRIGRQIRAYKKEDSPPKRVKPIPILIVIFVLAQAYGLTRDEGSKAIGDMITIAFFYLLRPGEYTGTTSDYVDFRVEEIALYIQDRRLDSMTATPSELAAADSVAYTCTTQKNGRRGEKMVHGTSGDGLCCPVKATARRLLNHRNNKCKASTPLASYYRAGKRVAIRAVDAMAVLRNAMTLNYHKTGIAADEVSARSLCAGGAMALICGQIDPDHICMLGRWHSDAMMRYLHMQARAVVGGYAVKMFNKGTYTFLPDETVPIVDLDE